MYGVVTSRNLIHLVVCLSVAQSELVGRGRGLAVTGVTVALGALALADLPPFVSSDGHALLVEAADQAGLPWLEIVVALTVGLTSGAVLRAAGRIWLGWGAAQGRHPRAAPPTTLGTRPRTGPTRPGGALRPAMMAMMRRAGRDRPVPAGCRRR